jgi:hypothetical protein
VMRGKPAIAAALESGFAGGDYRAALRRAAATWASDPTVNARVFVTIAELCAGGGQDEQAIDWLYKADQARIGYVPYVNAYPRFEHMRSNPRFKELLRRMNLPASEP